MELNNGEKIILESKPHNNILIIWFLVKTVPLALTMVLFLSVGIFFGGIGKTALHNEAVIEEDISKEEKKKRIKRIESQNPFRPIIDYWELSALIAILSAIVTQIYLAYLKNTYQYVVTNQRCIFIGGIIKRIERSIPYVKVTDIQRTQNIVERMLGIWNVQVFTPGTSSMQAGQTKTKAELNYDGLTDSAQMYQTIHQYTQQNAK